MPRTIPPHRTGPRPRTGWTARQSVTSIALVVIVVVGIVAGPPTSPSDGTADEDEFADLANDEFVNVSADLGPGTCTPDEVAFDQLVTCSFPLVGNASRVDPTFSPHAVIVDNRQAASSGCTVEERTLVCADLLAPYEEGPFEVTVIPVADGQPLASATVTRTVDGVLGWILAYRRVPIVFAGVETTIGTFRSFALADDADAELLLRRDGEDEIVARVPALQAGEEDGEATIVVPEAGRWTITGCAPAPDGSCLAEGIRRPIHAVAPTPQPLLPDHNGPPEDRINLVFVGSGFGQGDDLPGTVVDLLAVDGEPSPLDAGGAIYDLDWGPFSIEPLRDEFRRFNLWYLPDDLPSGSIVINPAIDAQSQSQIAVEDLGLGNAVSIITVSRNGFADGSRANAELASFADDETLPDRSAIGFGSAYLPVDPIPTGAATTLTHELGHALFGLRDEYEEFAEFGPLEPLLGPPNCLASEAEAEASWGPLVGELDPMFDRWRTAMIDNDLWFEEDGAAEDFTVGFVSGGCFGPIDGTGAVRPTVRGLMNGEEPVFGAVNRRRVQAVLDLFPEPPPPTTTTTEAPAPAPTEETTATTDPSDGELASTPSGGDGGPSPFILLGGLGAAIAAAAAVLVVRRRPAAQP